MSHNNILLVILSIVAYVCGLYHLSLSWVLAICTLVVLTIQFKQLHKHDMDLLKEEVKLAREVETEDALREELRARGIGIPSWVVFSDFEKANWLNGLITHMWPFIAKATEDSIRYSVQPLLEYYQPSFLKSLSFSKLKLGKNPLTICGVKTQAASPDEVVLDLDVKWSADSDLVVKAVSNGGLIEIDTSIDGLYFSAVLRVTFSPLIKCWPCFSALSLSFTSRPALEYSLSTANVPLSAIPGLAGWLNNFLKEVSFSWMIWPKKLPIPILDMEAVDMYMLSQEYPKGIFRIMIIEAKGLRDGRMAKPDPYVQIKVGNSKKETKAVKKSLNPKFLQTFEFEVVHPWTQYVFLNLLDRDSISDDLMGSVEIPVYPLLAKPNEGVTDWHEVQKNGKVVGKSGKGYGKLRTTITWVPFSEEKMKSFVKEGLEQLQRDRERQARIARGELVPSHSISNLASGGFLHATVLEAKSLSKSNKVDPMVYLLLNKQKFKTRKINNSANPSWRAGKQKEYVQFEYQNVDTDVLKIKVYDHEMVGSNEKLGTAELSLSSLSPNLSEEVWVPLENHTGRVCLELRLVPNMLPDESGSEMEDQSEVASEVSEKAAEQEVVEKKCREAMVIIRVLEGKRVSEGVSGGVDPYVLVRLQSTGEEFSTSKVFRSANPRWDKEEFRFVTPDLDSDTIDLSVYDWESTRRDILLGRGSVKLKDLDLNESDPFDVPLSNRGASVRVSIRVTLIEKDEEAAEDPNSKTAATTSSDQDTSLTLPVSPVATASAVGGAGTGASSLHSEVDTPRYGPAESPSHDHEFSPSNAHGADDVSQSSSMMSRETSFGSLFDDSEFGDAGDVGDELRSERGRLIVHVEKAIDLVATDPYVKLKLGNSQNKTKVNKKSVKDPSWNSEFQFTVQDSLTDKLLVKVKSVKFFRNSNIGSLNIHVREIQASPNMEVRKMFPLQGVEHGKLGMSIRFVPLSSDTQM